MLAFNNSAIYKESMVAALVTRLRFASGYSSHRLPAFMVFSLVLDVRGWVFTNEKLCPWVDTWHVQCGWSIISRGYNVLYAHRQANVRLGQKSYLEWHVHKIWISVSSLILKEIWSKNSIDRRIWLETGLQQNIRKLVETHHYAKTHRDFTNRSAKFCGGLDCTAFIIVYTVHLVFSKLCCSILQGKIPWTSPCISLNSHLPVS